MGNRHKVFVSYHHKNDEYYRNQFEELFADKIYVSQSVEMGDIDPNLKADTIRQKIRDEYLRDTTVTVVLIGTETWKRKHVDWEISSSIRDTKYNPRSGLIGILLPSYQFNPLLPVEFDFFSRPYVSYNPHTIPPRIYDNLKNRFAALYGWTKDAYLMQNWIHQAFERRNKIIPDNSRDTYANNRPDYLSRWQD